LTREAVVELLFEMYQKRGFVTTDEIFNACEEAELSIFDTDYVSNKVIEKGAFVTDEQPLMHSDNTQSNEDELTDYTQTDYSEIFRYFNSNYPSMGFVIDYIKSVKPLQHGEMTQLITQMRSGNAYAKEIAVSKNMRLALKAAYNYRDKTSISLEDIFQQASMSVLKAIEAYDPYIHSAFTSYCGTWIKQGIDRYIMDYENLIRIPVHLYEKLIHIKRISEQYAYYSCDELVPIVASYMEISNTEASELIGYYSLLNISSLDEFFENYDDVDEMLAKLSKDIVLSEEDAFAMVDENYVRNEILKAISTLSSKESDIIRLRYGLDGAEKTLEEVGNKFNVTRERIRQIEAKALQKLRHPSRSSNLKDCY